MNDGVWLLPTRGRPDNLKRFMRSAREIGTSTPGLVIINKNDTSDYDSVRQHLLDGWEIIRVDATSYGESVRAVWSRTKDLKWIGLLADDHVPCTPNWDTQLIASLRGWNFVSSNDSWQAPNRMHGAVCFSGDLLRAVGWLFPDRLRHIFHDDIFETIGRETGCWEVRMDVMVKHLHEALQGIIGPTMDKNSLLWKHDEARFNEWLQYEKDDCVKKVRALQEASGVKMLKPDFSGVRLMIASPAHDGRYESSFMVGLFQTMEMLRQNGVHCELAEERLTADIALARAKLFSAFYRSKNTHCLWIDTDMGFGPSEVVRLFCAKKDFVAGAGPKKRLPLCFAANWANDFGDPLPLVYDTESGTMEVSEIGFAFTLITRACAEKMVSAYPELSYVGITGEEEWALFNPLVRKRRFFSEDFSFCYRYRAIGGRIFMAPEIELSHTGSFCFRGSFAKDGGPKQVIQEAAD